MPDYYPYSIRHNLILWGLIMRPGWTMTSSWSTMGMHVALPTQGVKDYISHLRLTSALAHDMKNSVPSSRARDFLLSCTCMADTLFPMTVAILIAIIPMFPLQKTQALLWPLFTAPNFFNRACTDIPVVMKAAAEFVWNHGKKVMMHWYLLRVPSIGVNKISAKWP